MPKRKVTQAEIASVLEKLKERFPTPGAMEFGTPFHALIAVLLSARTRDEQVLLLLPAFFKAFPDPEALSKATKEQIEAKINTIGMYRQKAKHLKQLAIRLVEVYDGKVPNTMEDLVTLAGVGRKTASVILPYHFNTPAIAVDTHVHRVTNRLGWVNTKTPQKTEEALLKLVDPKLYPTVNRVFVKHGRYVCIRNPRCWMCPIADSCPFKDKNLTEPKNAQDIEEDIDRREQRVQNLRNAIDV